MSNEQPVESQLDRLQFVELRVRFIGEIRRQDLVRRFGIQSAAASRDLALYKELAPDNIDYDSKTQSYVLGQRFQLFFYVSPELVLSRLIQEFVHGEPIGLKVSLGSNFPDTLTHPDLDVIASVNRAIHQKCPLSIEYHSISSGCTEREVVPFALIGGGLCWLIRAFDRNSQEFRDFDITRIKHPIVLKGQSVAAHEMSDQDIQWTRIVELELVPHPDQPRAETAKMDYAMRDGVLRIEKRAALVGYFLRQLRVDCSPDHSLRGHEFILWLKNHLALHCVKNAALAPGYRSPDKTRESNKVAYDPKRALELLRIGSGRADATFRDGQEDAIRHLVEGKGRLLVVQKTGWGKSFVYFIATKLLREAGVGPALLISPLLALMRNQIAAAERMGVRAVTINSDNMDDWTAVEGKLAKGEVDILLISPERLANERFRTQVLAGIAAQISMLVIDEAHCISDWGHDFRPHYRLLERIVKTLPPNLRLLATTATANNRVMKDLAAVLGPKLDVSRGDLNRTSLSLQTIRLPSQAERLAWLAEQLATLQGHGIIYTLTVRDANQVAQWLKTQGFNVEAYTGETGDRREQLEQALLNNQVKALVATTALGMGYDKPDLAFVIHYQMPGSVVAYYQQVGRAGRALDSAYGILLSGQEESDITDWFIRSAFPTRQEVADVLGALEDEPNGLSVPELLSRVNLSKGRVDKTIALLSLEAPAPIAKQDSKWQLTAATLSEAFWDRAERLTVLRRDEHQQMQDYVSLPFGDHMGFLISALDGDPSVVTEPALPPLPATVDTELVKAAVEFLRRTSLPIEPRKKWPDGGMRQYDVKGFIAPAHRAESGKALCVWGDAGWGGLVRKGKYHDSRFSDDLVTACVHMIEEWNPQPRPTWVTCVPSLRHPELVPNFAQRLAAALGLPFHMVIVIKKTDLRPEQKTMANSTQQARNIDGWFAVNKPLISSEPVLLVDDMVDSRWTLTVSAWLLREGGSGVVWPMALSQTGHGE